MTDYTQLQELLDWAGLFTVLVFYIVIGLFAYQAWEKVKTFTTRHKENNEFKAMRRSLDKATSRHL